MLTIKNADFSHGQALIFKNVNLDTTKGEIFCLLGPNGCGKTTLIDCILGIHKLDRGDIVLDNESISKLSFRQIARKMAYIPQTHTIHFSFSVIDMLLMGRTPYTPFYSSPKTADRELAEGLLDSLQLSHLMHRDYTKLSGGESQLMMILRALIQETPVIVMDEPTAHLDFKNELMVLEIIAKLIRERKITIIMASHFPNHAFYFENANLPVKVGFMNQQQVHLKGSPSKALTEYNIKKFYGVEASVVSHSIPQKGKVKQIIPIQTMENFNAK
jgi:iron complex transport system ATP-binding protein